VTAESHPALDDAASSPPGPACPDCDRAESHPRTGRFSANCLRCAARALAQSPEFHEAATSGVQTPRYRAALADCGVAHESVREWARRLA
jgi:hypothetical protein